MGLIKEPFTIALLKDNEKAPAINQDRAVAFLKTILKTLNICTIDNVQV